MASFRSTFNDRKLSGRNKVTDKRERFCQAYSKNPDVADAYMQAGFKAKDRYTAQIAGHRLLALPAIQQRLQELNKEQANKNIADAQEIKEKLTAIVRQELSEEVLMAVLKGNHSVVENHKKKNDVRCALKALELLGKMGGMFTENLNLNGGVQIVVRDDLTE